MKPLKIYMCDLTHDTVVLVTDTIPINVGYIGAYAKSQFGDQIELTFFKYPQSAIDAIATEQPDVLALSNYCWNSLLSEEVAKYAKSLRPSTLTVQGGTNFPNDAKLQLEFLKTRQSTDIHVQLEGEIAFSNVIRRVLDTRETPGSVFESPIDGTVFIDPATREGSDPQLVSGNLPPRIRDLGEIPSPYLTGLMDPFFDGRLTPFIETNRGCPFTCSFCHTGNDYFQKTNNFPLDRLREEIEYIAGRAAEDGIVNLHMADTNFGMYPRDKDIAGMFRDARENHGWPLHIMATTGKNNKERVINVAEILGDALPINMAMQSMDSEVLSTIRRSNIKLADYTLVNEYLMTQGKTSVAEMILGLPGETRESFLKGIEQVIESGVSKVTIYTLMLLDGTEFKDPGYRSANEIVGKYRIVPRNFTDVNGTLVFDYEEVGIQTKHMSYEDYLYLRGYSLFVETLHNDRVFEEIFRFALSLGVSRSEMVIRAYDSLEKAPQSVRDVLDQFLSETDSELWNDEEELVTHYRQPDNYQKLLTGEIGGNLIYKYKALSLTASLEGWIGYLAQICSEITSERLDLPEDRDAATSEIEAVTEYCRQKLDGLLLATASTDPTSMESNFDFFAWLGSSGSERLSEFPAEHPIRYEFVYTEDQLRQHADAQSRYGSDITALSVIVTRVGSVQSLVRVPRTEDGQGPAGDSGDEERFTRYSLAN